MSSEKEPQEALGEDPGSIQPGQTAGKSLLALGVLLTIAFFAIDLSIPLGIAGGVPYVAVVFLSLWLPGRRYTLVFALACTALTVLGFFFSPQGGELWKVLSNRFLALFAIWVTAVLCLFQRRATEALSDSHASLHRREQLLQRVLKEREVMEAQLVQAGKMAAIGELAGNFAHEVNNPVAIISGKAKLLLEEYSDDDLPQDVIEDLRKIDLHAERISKITNGLLAFSRPSLGKKERLDLNELVQSTLQFVDDAVRAARIRLVRQFDPALPRVLGNGNELQQVFLNILTNAIDAMCQGGVLEVDTRARVAQTSTEKRRLVVEVSISDSGPGMRDDIIERIFEPFFTTKGEEKGTGLGLSISQGLIHSHRGRIDVHSAPGKGTTFVVVLPALEEK